MAMVDYESGFKEANMVKYLEYLARIIEKLYNETGKFVPVRVIIIYTADVKRGQTNPLLDIGCIQLRIEEAFLSDLEPAVLLKEIEAALKKQDIREDQEVIAYDEGGADLYEREDRGCQRSR